MAPFFLHNYMGLTITILGWHLIAEIPENPFYPPSKVRYK